MTKKTGYFDQIYSDRHLIISANDVQCICDQKHPKFFVTVFRFRIKEFISI